MTADSAGPERPTNIGQLSAYWRSLADGQTPHRRQLQLDPIKDLLPYLLLIEFEDDPFRVRYRLTGTVVDQMTGMNITGRYLDEFAVGIYTEPVQQLQRDYLRARTGGQPVIETYHWPAGNGYFQHVAYGLFPFMVDGVVSQCLSIEDYGELTYDTQIIDWTIPLKEK
jgi:hypothetical protein